MRHETIRDYNAGYYAEMAEAEARQRQERGKRQVSFLW